MVSQPARAVWQLLPRSNRYFFVKRRELVLGLLVDAPIKAIAEGSGYEGVRGLSSG